VKPRQPQHSAGAKSGSPAWRSDWKMMDETFQPLSPGRFFYKEKKIE